MIKNGFYLLSALMFFHTEFAFGQNTKIEIPPFNDKYSEYVKQLENGKTDIDYVDFRNSFLDSKQFAEKRTNYDSLKRRIYGEIRNKKL